MKTEHRVRDSFDIWHCLTCGDYGGVDDQQGRLEHEGLPPFRAYIPLEDVPAECSDPWCDHPHEDADERWCEPHGTWKIGNPCS